MRTVRDVFVASFLLDEAGDGAFARGAVYEREDRVTVLTNDPDRLGHTRHLPPGRRHLRRRAWSRRAWPLPPARRGRLGDRRPRRPLRGGVPHPPGTHRRRARRPRPRRADRRQARRPAQPAVDHAADPDTARERAIVHLRDKVGRPFPDARGTYPADELIQILDHDGRDEDAWDTMLEHGCDHELAMRLASKREAEHPLDAITIYDRDVEELIDRKNKTGYRAAVRQLGHIRTLATRAGRPEVFDDILDRVRTEHRLKRTLMGFLDADTLG